MKTIIVIFALACVVLGSAIPKSEEHSGKHVKQPHISDHDHFDGEGEHNSEYDHDAFLGEEEAKKFENLSPEESLRRLGLIVDKIDKDGSGSVTHDELVNWIDYVQKKYQETDANRQWDEIGPKADKMAWLEYKKQSYGGLESGPDTESEEYEDAVKMERRDKKRFAKADLDNDGMLDRAEFNAFIHPEEHKHMRECVIAETLEDIDKDGDGFVSMEEYINDMWAERDSEKEPEWVERERKNFKEQRDKDGDGKLGNDEVADWIIPEEYDHMRVEAKHLFKETDADKDGVLSKQEILDKHDLFVGSQATDYGEAINRHDEF